MTVSKCPCLTFSAAMSCLDAKISLVPKHKLVVPSSYLPLQHTSEQTRPQSRKATQPQIHTLRPLTYELFFQKRSKIERVVLNRECIEGIFCTKLGQNSNPQRLTYAQILVGGRNDTIHHFENREAPEKRRDLWNEKDHVTAISQVHRRQRNKSWTWQKKQGFICFHPLWKSFRLVVF